MSDVSRCVWCRQSCHSATRMHYHVEARLRDGKCDPDNLRSVAVLPRVPTHLRARTPTEIRQTR